MIYEEFLAQITAAEVAEVMQNIKLPAAPWEPRKGARGGFVGYLVFDLVTAEGSIGTDNQIVLFSADESPVASTEINYRGRIPGRATVSEAVTRRIQKLARQGKLDDAWEVRGKGLNGGVEIQVLRAGEITSHYCTFKPNGPGVKYTPPLPDIAME